MVQPDATLESTMQADDANRARAERFPRPDSPGALLQVVENEPESEAPSCFAVPRLADRLPPLDPLKLTATRAEAAAALLPMLMCDEESAILTSEALSVKHADAGRALARIAQEEQLHELLLRRLKAVLPVSADTTLRRATRRFFVQVAERDTGLHCARIAALDSAVCSLLGALRARGSPFAKEPSISAILTRIHRDEARHVM
jgi:hypothetical protein